jgi:hypothetical protein
MNGSETNGTSVRSNRRGGTGVDAVRKAFVNMNFERELQCNKRERC